MSFIEKCDEFDPSIWVYEYEEPAVSGGAWVMSYPAGVSHSYRPVSKSLTQFGYGRYKITFQTSGKKDPGVNYGVFFYNDGGPGKYNELDIPEVRGFHGGNSLSISCYRNMDKGPVDSGAQQPVYQYWNSYKDCNDGQVHTFEFNWLPDKLEFFVDGVLDHTWLEGDPGQEGGAQPHIPVPPMYFYPFGAQGTAQNGDYWVKCLQIEYTPAGSTTAPDPTPTLSYPSDRWQRLWYTHSTGAYLGETPDEPNLRFDDNWASGVVAYAKSDDIEFSSSRTLNLPVTGDYTFTLGSDDGSRLSIDDVLVIDKWLDQSYKTASVTKNLTAGNHKFRIDWYEKGGAARVSFTYTEPTVVTPPDTTDPCADVKTQLASAQALNAALQSQINTLNTQISSANAQITSLNAKITSAKVDAQKVLTDLQ